MSGLDIKVDLDLKDVRDDIDLQVNNILTSVLRNDIPAILRAEQQQGFPTDPEDYTLILRNRGREARRQLSTIQPQYLKLGSARSPLEFTFTSKGGGFEQAVSAAIIAFEMIRRRAPVDEGHYLESLGFFVAGGGREIALARRSLLTFDFKDEDSIYIGSTVPYSTTIEKGFYKGYYEDQTRKGGILYWVTRQIRKQYGDRVAIRFKYTKSFGVIMPVIEFGRKGDFLSKDWRVTDSGRGRRRRRG